MLFDFSNEIFESDKERNLYTKFFAGYFFNEFISNYERRVNLVQNYFSEILGKNVKLKKPHVSFDNHLYLFDIGGDRGEFADIMLQDPEEKTIIAIEAKYLTNWNANTDLIKNLNRIDQIRGELKDYSIYFILLISEVKWDSLKKMENHQNSNYAKYLKSFKNSVAIAFWEQLIALCENRRVEEFMKNRLALVNADHKNRLFRKT